MDAEGKFRPITCSPPQYPAATAHFLKLPLSEETKRKILWDNCARLYGSRASEVADHPPRATEG